MPRLGCDVTNCAHNCSEQCCLNQIDVAGSQATNSIETCCSNFIEQTGATNSLESPNDALEVGCKAENCKYNEECKCCADAIDIAGQGACDSEETCCSTFRER